MLYSEWSPTESGTRWLPADTDESRFVWDGYRAIPALLDGRSVIVASFATDECFSDVPNMVARDLETGADTTLQCGTGGPDDGWGPNSYGGGLYVGDAWSAVTDQGAMLSSIGLVFRDERGAIIEHPANPYSDDCHPCELTAALSPDGERLAVIYRPDALQFRNENWAPRPSTFPRSCRCSICAPAISSSSTSCPLERNPASTGPRGSMAVPGARSRPVRLSVAVPRFHR